jgi:hypothetical protein
MTTTFNPSLSYFLLSVVHSGFATGPYVLQTVLHDYQLLPCKYNVTMLHLDASSLQDQSTTKEAATRPG